MPECDIFNFKDVTLTVRKWFFFLKGHLVIQGLWLTAPQCTGLSSIFFCYTDETRIILEQRKEIMKSLCAITFWVMSLHRSSQRLSFIFPYYHYYNYYYYSVSVLAPCTMGEKTTKMEVDVCVPPEQRQRTRKGSREADPRGRDTNWWQTDRQREVNLTAPDWQEKKGQTDQKTHKFHERSHPGIGHSAVKPCDRCWFSVLYCHLVEAATDSNNRFNWVTYYKLTTTCQRPVMLRIQNCCKSLNWVKTTVFSV